MPHIDRIATRLGDVGDSSKGLGVQNNLVVVDKGVFVHATEYITSGYVIADLDG
jgi:hypothetical protein